MQIGMCGDIERAPIIKALGFDYIEEGLSRISMLSEDEFKERVKAYEKLDLPVYALNLFFIGGTTFYGENALENIEKYATCALHRAYNLGGKICVIGNGRARNIPNEIPRQIAEQRFCDVVSLCGEIADKYGIKIAIEPLNKNETNCVNTVAQAADVTKRVGKENIGTLIDFYHFYMENEDDSSISENIDSVIHTHIARPNKDRMMPRDEDMDTVAHWAKLLKNAGYNGAISFEVLFNDFEKEINEIQKSMAFFR